ncbi:zinc finger and SCAN domain-containing protein 2-like [Dunckerocampus dactyliophorus]|uniref:zinc finger and SCAN domain-containing protein 2-like n=1 Tax=Dunckerocampus dactyliophorus TaxID=161453 RepID=UPI002405A213|nr:zinc finger and SCAN domain-containing protein 2-like [Dunckerocampus dactyliophorus]
MTCTSPAPSTQQAAGLQSAGNQTEEAALAASLSGRREGSNLEGDQFQKMEKAAITDLPMTHVKNVNEGDDDVHQQLPKASAGQQEQTLGVAQREPKPPHIKEENDKQARRQRSFRQKALLQGRKEAQFQDSQLDHVKREQEWKVEAPTNSLTAKAHKDQLWGSEPNDQLSPCCQDDDDMESESSETEDTDGGEEPSKSKRASQAVGNNFKLVCVVCGARFQLVGYLRKHLNTHLTTHTTATGEKTFECVICGKTFTDKTKITAHFRVHAVEKPFSCSICGQEFLKKCHLKKHDRTHSGQVSFSCSVCGKGLTSKYSLNCHMRTHTGEKPYSCSVCSRSFATQPALMSHKMIHGKEKPFTCSVCAESFSQKGNLMRHLRIHTGEKPFSCSACAARFSQKEHLMAHLKTHEASKPFTCSVCDKTFSRLQQAEKHKCTGKKGRGK